MMKNSYGEIHRNFFINNYDLYDPLQKGVVRSMLELCLRKCFLNKPT